MIKLPSVQNEYTLIWSGDPALKLPDDKAERARALKEARDTGKWDEITAPAATPTLFHFRDLTRTEFGYVIGERAMSARLGRPLSPIEFNDLVVRVGMRSVENLGAHKVDRMAISGIWQATGDIIDVLGAACPGALAEFADHLIERAQTSPRPL